jgi:GT2 family glycosyltransferase
MLLALKAMASKDLGTVSIVIPSYNGKELLFQNLPKVLEAAGNPVNRISEVIVVDDGSTDTSVEFIKKTFPNVKLVTHKTNKGFSAAVNSGVGASSGEYVVLLNNDVFVGEDFLAKALPFMEKDPDVFAVSFHQKGFGWARGYFKDGYILHSPGSEDLSPHETFFVNAGGAIYRKNIWNKLGGMDKRLFSPFYWEDVDISYRAAKRGYKLFWHPGAQVSENLSATVGRIPKKKVSRIQERNHLLFIWKNLTSSNFFRRHLLGLLQRLLKHPGYILIVAMALTKLGSVIAARKKEKRESKLSDETILARF